MSKQKPQRKPGRIRQRRDKAVRAAARKTAPPAAVLSAAAVLQMASVPDGWILATAAGITVWYGRNGVDAIRARRSGGKRAARQRRKYQGTATSRELHGKLSLKAARRRAKVTRPLTPGGRLAPSDAGVLIGSGGRPARRLYGTHEDFYAAFGTVRSGKTGWMAGRVLDAPGAVAAFTTRTDLREHTVIARAQRGPVFDLNPGGEGGVPTNFGLSPLDGCWDPSAAIESAGYLVHAAPSDKGGKDAHWDAAGCDLLRLMMHAAALTEGATMRHVAAWVRDPAAAQPLATLARNPYAAPGWAHELAELAARDGDYLSGVIAAARSALRWMADPVMAAVACPEESGLPVLDIPEFLADGATLYVTAANRPHNSLAPYSAWLCSRLFDTAKRMAAQIPGARMDPPLTLVPDEPALTCPVPLDRWTAEAGGWGITIITGFQSRSQLPAMWGEHGGRTVWNNATVKLIFGGFTDDADLKAFSDVCGPRDTWHHVRNPDGSKTRQPGTEPLFAPEKIRLIPEGSALLLHRRTRPLLADVDMVWDRKGYERALPGWALPQPAPEQPLAIEAPKREAIPMPGAPAPAIEDRHPVPIEEVVIWQEETADKAPTPR